MHTPCSAAMMGSRPVAFCLWAEMEDSGGGRVFVAPNSIINITCKLSITCVPGLGHQGSSAKILPKLLKETKNNAHQTGLGSAGLCQVIHQPLYPHQLNGAGADPRED